MTTAWMALWTTDGYAYFTPPFLQRVNFTFCKTASLLPLLGKVYQCSLIRIKWFREYGISDNVGDRTNRAADKYIQTRDCESGGCACPGSAKSYRSTGICTDDSSSGQLMPTV
jgi:hypothetical protein